MWDWNKFNRLMLQLPAAQESLAVSHFAPESLGMIKRWEKT